MEVPEDGGERSIKLVSCRLTLMVDSGPGLVGESVSVRDCVYRSGNKQPADQAMALVWELEKWIIATIGFGFVLS